MNPPHLRWQDFAHCLVNSFKRRKVIQLSKQPLELRFSVLPDPEHIKQYNQICGFTQVNYLALTYPQVLGFPGLIKLANHPDFPYPPMGMIHIKNDIQQLRRIQPSEMLHYTIYLGDSTYVKKGIQFHLHMAILVEDEPVWRATMTCLHLCQHQQNYPSQQNPVQPTDAPELLISEQWDLAKPLAWQYAKISQDFNPIHLSTISAKLFGFKAPIIHGLYSQARALAHIESSGIANTSAKKKDKIRIKCEFKKPLFLPSICQFKVERSATGLEFKIMDKQLSHLHLTGSLSD